MLPPGTKKLVLLAHDESMMQANDGEKAGWGSEGEQPILKKRACCGEQESDIICSTYGWLKDAGEQLGYGKGIGMVRNLLSRYKSVILHNIRSIKCKSRSKTKLYLRLHGPDYQALIMVDNSQGHSVWPKDALHVQNMDLNPGGKVPHIHDRWFTCDGMKFCNQWYFHPITQPSLTN